MNGELNILKMAFERMFTEVEALKKEVKEQHDEIMLLKEGQKNQVKGISNELWSTKKVLNYLGICYNTLQKIVDSGLIKRIKINQRKYRYTPESIQQYLEKRTKLMES